jgi:DNA-binding NarL/FixJ family response regulator
MPVTVAIVEDNADYAEGIRLLLDQSGEFTCTAVCPSAEHALAVLPTLKPEIVLMDIGLPARSGADCVRELKELLPDTAIMMLTVVDDYELIYESLKNGALGYLLKGGSGSELLAALRELRASGSPMSGTIARKVLNAFRQFMPAPGADDLLSPREREVLQALASGCGYKGAAEQLGVSHGTVRAHANHSYKKLHVHSRAEAVRKVGLRR